MSNLRSIDLSLIVDVFQGNEGRGYVLDFSNRTFTDFFARELGIDIDAPIYAAEGSSKAKRLRCFLGQVDDATAARTLRALWNYRQGRYAFAMPEPAPQSAGQIIAIIARLDGSVSPEPKNVVAAPMLDAIDFARMNDRLLEIRNLQPHARGYEFERFLTELFDAFRLKAREPFRLAGEQIDGSLELGGEIYLVEAKWLNKKVGAAELHVFHGKLEQKAGWARGVFISFGGFTDEGLEAFGRGKRVIAVSGKDIKDSFEKCVGIDRLIQAKVRHAAETGAVFVPFSDLRL